MPALPYRRIFVWSALALIGAALVAQAIRSDAGQAVLIEARDPPGRLDRIVVDVGGAVLEPGIYEVQPGDRVADTIQLAGGATAEADPAALNLARRVQDEDQIRVPRRGEQRQALDLNLASAAELEALPGIGPARAAIIVEARAVRPFTSSDELVTRGLIPESVYSELRDLVATPTRSPATGSSE